MRNLLKRALNQPEQEHAQILSNLTGEQALAAQGEIQSLRLELAERDRVIASLKADLEQHRASAEAQAAQALQARMERLLTEVARPVTQLVTQIHLVRVEKKAVPVNDVLTVAGRLLRTLEDQELTLLGHVGEQQPFDLNHHEPLDVGMTFVRGELVVVKFVGVAYRGKVIKKAGIAKA